MTRKKLIRCIVCTLVIIMCMFSVLTVYIEKTVFPRGAEVLHSYAENNMFEILNQSISDVMDKYSISYDSLVNITYDNSGVINSVSIDYFAVNKIKSDISVLVSKRLNNVEGMEVDVPLGAFSNNMYFMGKGPDIKFRLVQRGCIYVDFEHEFEGAGVNQVMHTLKVKISADIALILPFYDTHTYMDTSAILAQTIINGDSPHQFLDINEGG